MTEDESYKQNLGYMRGQIETLQQILRITIATMSDKQREFIASGIKEFALRMEESAKNKDTDLARDKASAIYETVEKLTEPQDWVDYFEWFNQQP